LAEGEIWFPMSDLFAVGGNRLLDNVMMPAPYKERIASLVAYQHEPSAALF